MPEQLTAAKALADPENEPQGEVHGEGLPTGLVDVDYDDPYAESDESSVSVTDPLPEGGAESKGDEAQKAINRQHYKYKEEERAHEETRRKLQEAEERIRQASAPKRPVVIPMPDLSDSDYYEKVEARERSIAAQAAYDKEISFSQRRIQEQQQLQLQQRQVEANKATQNFYKRAIDSGIDYTQLKEREIVVAQNIADPQVSLYLLESARGPEIVSHLAQNPLELSKVAGISAIQAGLYIEQKIVPTLRRPSQSILPDPITTPSGRGSVEQKDRFLDGVTYE